MTSSDELEAASRNKRGRKREKNPGPAPPRETKLTVSLGASQ